MVLFVTLLVLIDALLVNVRIDRVVLGDLYTLEESSRPCRCRRGHLFLSPPDVGDVTMSQW